VRDNTLVSANDTMATANPPINTGTMSAAWSIGNDRPGSPCGKVPSTGTPARVDKSSAPTTMPAPTTANKTPGTRWRLLSSKITASDPTPSASATPLVRPASRPSLKLTLACNKPSPPAVKPNSAGNWLTNTVKAMPFM